MHVGEKAIPSEDDPNRDNDDCYVTLDALQRTSDYEIHLRQFPRTRFDFRIDNHRVKYGAIRTRITANRGAFRNWSRYEVCRSISLTLARISSYLNLKYLNTHEMVETVTYNNLLNIFTQEIFCDIQDNIKISKWCKKKLIYN